MAGGTQTFVSRGFIGICAINYIKKGNFCNNSRGPAPGSPSSCIDFLFFLGRGGSPWGRQIYEDLDIG